MRNQFFAAAILLLGISTAAFAGPISVRVTLGSSCPTPVIISAPPTGRYVDVVQRTWVPGYTQTVYVPTQYTTAYDAYGRAYTVVAAPGHYETQQIAGYYTQQTVRQWVADAPCATGYGTTVYATPGYRDWNRDSRRDWDRDSRRDWDRDNRRDYDYSHR